MEQRTRPLTPKQERFCQEYTIDGNATGAARRAGYSAKTAHVQGPRLLGNVSVKARIAELQAAAANRAEVSINDVIAMLLDDHRAARAAGQYGPAVRAVELLGRRLGMFVDRYEVSEVQKLSDDELIESLARGDPARADLVRQLLPPRKFDA